jgi:iodotyrosine deiodinase
MQCARNFVDNYKLLIFPFTLRIMKKGFILYKRENFDLPELQHRAANHYSFMQQRRTVRDFSTKEIPLSVIEDLIMTASTAPSGANKQPWTFCIVTNATIKKKIRIEAEKEEYESYHHRMPEEWLKDLQHLGTNWEKPFLEIAPVLIVVFKKTVDIVDGSKKHNYYVQESVGLACGFLLQAIYHCGLVALTHTPSPMNFLCEILKRPSNEKPFLLIPVGYPANEVYVPDIPRKKAEDVIQYYI